MARLTQMLDSLVPPQAIERACQHMRESFTSQHACKVPLLPTRELLARPTKRSRTASIAGRWGVGGCEGAVCSVPAATNSRAATWVRVSCNLTRRVMLKAGALASKSQGTLEHL